MATDGNDGNGNNDRDNVEPSVVVVEVVAVDPVVARSWGVVLALGILAVIVGIVFLVSLKVAVFTLVIIVALALFVSGLIEFALAHAYRSPAVGYVIGVIWIAVGIMALVWPKATLFVVAFLVGIGLLLAGCSRIIAAVSTRASNGLWGWTFVGGIISTIAGLFCMFWPHATVLVLAVILGVRTLVAGIVDISLALRLRKAAKAAEAAQAA